MNALSSTEWATVMMITVVAHAFCIKFLINMRTLVDHVLLAFFNHFGLRFFYGVRVFGIDCANTDSIMYRGSTEILFDFFAYLLAVDLCFFGGFGACLRFEVSQFLPHRRDILEENLQDIFLNLFLSGCQIIRPKSRFQFF